MSNLANVFTALPDAWQHRLSAWLCRTGGISLLPLFRMFLRTFEFTGARRSDALLALRTGQGGWLRAAADAARDADDLLAQQQTQQAAAAYHRASIYALSSCWGVPGMQTHANAYRAALGYFAHYAALTEPRAQRIRIACAHGDIPAIWRMPDGACRGAVVLFPGSDQTKEWMQPFELLALRRNLATVSVDLPGFAENARSGSRFCSLDSLAEPCRSIASEVERRLGAGTPIASFGVSLGGLFALSASAFEPRIVASIGVGSPLTVGTTRRVAAVQRDAALRWSGARSFAELTRQFSFERVTERLRQVGAHALIVHGSRDEVVAPNDAQLFAAHIGDRAKVVLLPGDDHMCTRALARGAGERWFDWLSRTLDEALTAQAPATSARAC